MPHELTQEEMRHHFMLEVMRLITYWEENERFPGVREKLEGLVNNLFLLLDGTAKFPTFELVPRPCPEDREFSLAHGEDWWPTQEVDEDKCIGGPLHEYFRDYRVIPLSKLSKLEN